MEFHLHCENFVFFSDCHHLGIIKCAYLYLLVLDQRRWADIKVFAHYRCWFFWMGWISWPQQCLPVNLSPEEQFYRPPGLDGTGRIALILFLLSIQTQVSNWDVVLFHGSAVSCDVDFDVRDVPGNWEILLWWLVLVLVKLKLHRSSRPQKSCSLHRICKAAQWTPMYPWSSVIQWLIQTSAINVKH